jgi:regulator of protease activity HflC (stomatin/prohibitin superfamily)
MTNMNKLYVMAIASFCLIIILSGALFTVNQKEIGVVFQFGEAVRIV